MDCIKMLVEEFHSAVAATIGANGLPQTRVIDMMLYDENGVYFLTARGKDFYSQLIEQEYISLSAVKEKRSVSLRGKVKSIGQEKLLEIFNKNPYMKEIYPEGRRSALEVFCIYEAEGEYFDISTPSKTVRERFKIGNTETVSEKYTVNNNCIGCKACIKVCPQGCIDFTSIPAVILQNHCLNCGACAEICPQGAIEKR